MVGLREALKKAETSGLAERETIVDLIMQALEPDNCMPPAGYVLRPVIHFVPPSGDGAHPQLLLEKLAVVKGCPPMKTFQDLVRKYTIDR